MKTFNSILILTALLYFGCSQKDDSDFILNNNTQKVEFFEMTENREFETLFEFSGGNVTRIIEHGSKLILLDVKGVNNQFVHVYDAERKEASAGIFYKGDGPFESVSPYAMGMIGTKIWLQDFTRLKIIFFDFNDSTYSEKRVPFHLYGVNFLTENQILASSIDNSAYKFQLIDIDETSITKEFGDFYKYPDNLENSVLQTFYQRKSMVSPDKKRVATAYRWSNTIEITHLSDYTSMAVFSPDRIQNEKDIFEHEGKLIFDRSGTTIKCYNDIYVTDNFIYALFSGLEDSNPDSRLCQLIHVFDWGGAPIKQINLDRGVSAISVTPNDSRIYSFDIDTGEVVYIVL